MRSWRKAKGGGRSAPELRGQVEVLRNRLGLRQVDVSKECGVNASMLSQWMLGRYKGNVGRVRAKRKMCTGNLLTEWSRADQRAHGVLAHPTPRRQARRQECVCVPHLESRWRVSARANVRFAFTNAVVTSNATSPKLKRKLDDANDPNNPSKRCALVGLVKWRLL